jgi:hypothetical protein
LAGGFGDASRRNRLDAPTAAAGPVIGPAHRGSPASRVRVERRDLMADRVGGENHFKFEHTGVSKTDSLLIFYKDFARIELEFI